MLIWVQGSLKLGLDHLTISYTDKTEPGSEFWEKCARHQNKQTSRNIAHLFLCDACARKLTSECFNNRHPIYHGSGMKGYCGLCNEWQEIALRQWFIDPICLNVVFSYPKSIAASKLVTAKWNEIVNPHYPNLILEELDAVRLEPFVVQRRSAATKQSAIDFCVKDASVSNPPVLFFIELKAGPSSLLETGGMSVFQLDVNDYVDIVNVIRAEQKPAYIFHAQVVEEYQLPTRRSVGKGIWWTDIFTLRDNLIEVKHRRGEDKEAGYYNPAIFKPIDQFLEQLNSRTYEALTHRLISEGISDLPE